jgi:phospholipid/cholesterol/gamma-HCH transport system ATP-binding protein
MASPALPAEPHAAEAPLFEIRGLTKRYGRKKILDGLDFDILRGECLCILGRSGSGKSVTLRQLNGLEPPDEGSVFFEGVDLGELSERQLFPLRRRIAMLFQGGALFDSMNVFENVAFPLVEHTRMRRAEVQARVDQLLAQVGLTGMGHKQVSELSGGMRKRVGLARALVRDPEFLLYDEPTTGLDPVLASAMDRLILETQRANPRITSVVISHDMTAVFRIGDKVAFLVDGVVLHEGDPEYFRTCEDPLVRQFVTGSLDGPMTV